MKIISREEGDTTKYYYLYIELPDGKEVEVTVTQTYHTNPDFSDIEVEILDEKELTEKEIEEVKEFTVENYLED